MRPSDGSSAAAAAPRTARSTATTEAMPTARATAPVDAGSVGEGHTAATTSLIPELNASTRSSGTVPSWVSTPTTPVPTMPKSAVTIRTNHAVRATSVIAAAAASPAPTTASAA